MNVIIKKIQDDWIRATDSNKPIIVHPKFDFSPNFMDSNLYCIYFLYLMRYKSVNFFTIQKLFNDHQIGMLLQKKVYETYRETGRAISECLESSTYNFTAAQERIVRMFQAGSSEALDMNQEIYQFLYSTFRTCDRKQEEQFSGLLTFLKTIVPQVEVLGIPFEKTDAYEHTKFHNFLPLPNQPTIPLKIRI